MAQQDVSLIAVGDIYIAGAKNPFAKTKDLLKSADLTFANLEGSYFDGPGTIITWSPSWSPAATVTGGLRSCVKGLEYIADAGVDVVQFANNHCMDYGADAFVATLDNLDDHGIKYCGAGRKLREATKPAIFERNGLRFAFLSYASQFKWFSGRHNREKPGFATIRVDPMYEPPHINKEEIASMVNDIKFARQSADIVIVADHWGVGTSHTLAVSQRAIGHAAIDAGADLVLGTHPHVLQGIEIYRGKLIIYSLANFVFSTWQGGFDSMVLNVSFSTNGVTKAFFYPVIENALRQPELAQPGGERFGLICNLMRGLCKELETELVVDNDKVWIKK